jgi:hypothetical protein
MVMSDEGFQQTVSITQEAVKRTAKDHRSGVRQERSYASQEAKRMKQVSTKLQIMQRCAAKLKTEEKYLTSCCQFQRHREA